MLRNALKHLTVVDFTHIGAGPTCTMQLADMGARVIKIEPLGGELGRSLGPGWIGNDSTVYHAFNRNKQSIALNLRHDEGLAIARQLIGKANVVVESMRPGAMARRGLSYDQLKSSHPDLIYCSISAYGQTGPYKENAGVDGILQADSGLMSLLGTEGTEPSKVQTPIVDIFTGYLASMAILAKLQSTERGGHLDINLLNSALALQQSALTDYLAEGSLPRPSGSAAPYSAPNEAFEATNGWIMIAAYNGGRWERLCDVLGLSCLASDPRFLTSPDRVKNRAAMKDELSKVIRTRTVEEWITLLSGEDILCAKVANYEDVMAHPQLIANRMIVEMNNPSSGETVRVPGFPIGSAQENQIPHTIAPMLGQHSREILLESGLSNSQIDELAKNKIIVEVV